MTSKVTALVSAYYAEQYIEGRLANLMAQSIKPDVIVIAKDGSKEMEAAERFYKTHPGRITIIETDDIPPLYEAWNRCISVVATPYITNANCDDRLYPDALVKLVAALETNPEYSVAYSDIDIVDKIGGEPVGRFTWNEGGLDVLLQGCFLGPMPLWRTALHDKYGLFDAAYRSAGDYEYWLRLAAGGVKFWHIRKEPLGIYLDRKDSLAHREELRSIWETARARSKYRKE